MIFRWAPTNARKFVTQQSATPTCPLCHLADETVAHMLCYPSPTAVTGRDLVLANLVGSLEDMGTHPNITSFITLAICTRGQPDNTELDIDLQDILNAQMDIGWDLLQFGFAATAWKTTQHQWAQHRDPDYSFKRSERWARLLQESL